jgi:hypothetical protein
LIREGENPAFANQIMEIVRINHKTIYKVKYDVDSFKNLYVGGILKYRLATERELKLDKIKKMFINE